MTFDCSPFIWFFETKTEGACEFENHKYELLKLQSEDALKYILFKIIIIIIVNLFHVDEYKNLQ